MLNRRLLDLPRSEVSLAPRRDPDQDRSARIGLIKLSLASISHANCRELVSFRRIEPCYIMVFFMWPIAFKLFQLLQPTRIMTSRTIKYSHVNISPNSRWFCGEVGFVAFSRLQICIFLVMVLNFPLPKGFDLVVADENWTGEDFEAQGAEDAVDGYVDAF